MSHYRNNRNLVIHFFPSQEWITFIVAFIVRYQEAGGSNPLAPTTIK